MSFKQDLKQSYGNNFKTYPPGTSTNGAIADAKNTPPSQEGPRAPNPPKSSY